MKNGNTSRFLAKRRRMLCGCLLFALTAVLCLLPAGGSGEADGENLLENGSFEALNAQGLPDGWETDAYRTEAGYTVFSVAQGEGPDGQNAASIRNIGLNDARFSQTVAVESESLYRFSGYIRAENVSEGLGANLSIEGLYVFSESIYDTEGEWQYVEWYGETGENQGTVTLFARLGGYSGESTGQAWFAGLNLTEVTEVPGDAIADLWYSQRSIGVYDEDDSWDAGESGGTGSPAWPRLILIVMGYTLAAVLWLQHLRRQENARTPRRGMSLPAFLGGLALALLLRLILSYFVQGYMVDVNCFLSWGHTMAEVGPVQFYPATSFCDYPPAYTYILGLNALICRWIPSLSDGMVRVVYRFVPSLCDVLACVLLDGFLRRTKPALQAYPRRTALLLLAFHPVSVLNGACWCQMDSVLALLLLLVAVRALEGKWHRALPCFMLAVLVKPQALMLGFLGLLATAVCFVRQKETRRGILQGLGGALIVFLIVVIPFSLKQDPFWIVSQYAQTLGSYPYATVNTANLYYLFGGNWDAIANPAAAGACAALAVLSAAYGGCLYTALRGKFAKAAAEPLAAGAFSLFFIICALAGASWSVVGTGAMAFAFLVVLGLYGRKRDLEYLPYLGGLLFLTLYVFGIKMHERYIFPAFLLLALAYALTRNRRILIVLAGITVTAFLNEGIVLDNSIRLGSAQGHLNADTYALAMGVAVVNCAAAVYAMYAGIRMLAPETAPAPQRRVLRGIPGDNRLHWNRKDTAVLSVLLAVYAAVSLGTLGSTKAPQTAWTSTDYTENVVLDLGQTREDFVMLYFARVSRYDFSVAVSDDGETWRDETWAQMDQGQCWKWKYVTDSDETGAGTRSYSGNRHWFTGRYVRITAHQINLALCEVIFRNEAGERLPVRVLARQSGDDTSPLYSDPEALVDEQDTFEGLPVWFAAETTGSGDETDPAVAQPSWWNSTYFDEIYHARTAWEFLTGSAPYETSHPPLGKILMSWGVAVFGMTPFGWRFAGAFAGILMLAGLYLVAKQMTKRTCLAAFAASLMALDCMHLTQTQIATIDSFPVLFILFAFFFMLRFVQTDWRKERRGRTLTDLGLSGLFMGLGIASKWIGIYAGAGLALLFFWHGGRILIRDRAERAGAAGDGQAAEGESAWRIFLKICLWCVPFFVLVPAAIYLLSYIPYFAYRHISSLPAYLEAVMTSQTGMLQYHATPGLGMDHPFYSPWYEWPVIGKPMFYATKQYVFNDTISSSIFCIGNPVIWYLGLPALMICAWMWVRNRHEALENAGAREAEAFSGLDTALVFLLVGFLAQYLPWMMVPRGTYIYHYFASTPFLMLALTAVFQQILLRRRKAGLWGMAAFALLSFAAMALFFPYVTGIYAPVAWLDLGKKLLKIWY